MPALTVRNIPDEIHRALKARAVDHGRSTEAEVREILASAVNPKGRLRMGSALAAIWGPLGLTDEEAAMIDSVRDRKPAEPLTFD